MDNSLPKTDRLLKPNDFAQVFSNTRLKVHTDHLIALIGLSKPVGDDAIGADVLCAADPKPNRVRLGLAVSKKKLKKAVDRNRLKRLIREQHRLQKGHLAQILRKQGLGDLDLVLVCKRTPPEKQEALFAESGELYGKLARKLIEINQSVKPARHSQNRAVKKSN